LGGSRTDAAAGKELQKETAQENLMGLVATLILEAQFLERRPLGKYVPELVVFAELNMEYCFAS